jgi:hypothetical protein
VLGGPFIAIQCTEDPPSPTHMPSKHGTELCTRTASTLLTIVITRLRPHQRVASCYVARADIWNEENGF